MTSAKFIRINEHGPREGFQSIKSFISTELKIEILNALSDTGVKYLSVTSFVSPRIMPQMKDADEVMSRIRRADHVVYGAFVPNVKELKRAVDSGVMHYNVGTSATDSFQKRNVNRTVAETLDEAPAKIEAGKEAGIEVGGAISVAFGCPFEGEVKPSRIVELAKTLRGFGLEKINIADTIGAANPTAVYELFSRLVEALPDVEFSAHFHDTRGMGIANVIEAMRAGVHVFDASVGGLGGCPFAPGAAGNICTEDLVYMLHEMGIETGIDVDKYLKVAGRLEEILGYQVMGKLIRAGKFER